MNSIITVLNRIEKNPLLYLGQKNLRSLRAFIDGYIICEQDNNKKESSIIFENFIKYFNDIFGVQSYYDFCSVLRNQYESEEEAFDSFFKLFNNFIIQSQTKNK